MIVEFTEDQMVEIWKLLRGFEPLTYDGLTIHRTDGVNLQTFLKTKIRAWYLDLLDNAPLDLLAVDEGVARMSFSHFPGGVCRVTMPQSVRRVVSVTVGALPATIVDADSMSAKLARCDNTRVSTPLAVVDHRRLTLYLPKGLDGVDPESVRVVEEPANGLYRIDRKALGFISENKNY